jgi:ribosomal protein S18 acetylase RimI-like enzyme
MTTSCIEPTEDVALLSELNRDIQKLHVSNHPSIFKPFNQADIETAFSQMLQDESYHAVLVKVGEDVAGYMIFAVLVQPENAFQYERKSIHIDQIHVLKQFRKLGNARRLVEHAIDHAKEIGADKVQLDHWSTNSEAKAFFTSFGFENFREQMEIRVER